MITTRDIKVFIFSVLFSTVCYALFNQSIKEANAQMTGGPGGPGGMPPMTGGMPGGPGGGGLLAIHAQKAREIHNNTYDLLQAHISGAIANHTVTQERLEAHISGAIAKHAEMLVKLDALLAR